MLSSLSVRCFLCTGLEAESGLVSARSASSAKALKASRASAYSKFVAVNKAGAQGDPMVKTNIKPAL